MGQGQESNKELPQDRIKAQQEACFAMLNKLTSQDLKI